MIFYLFFCFGQVCFCGAPLLVMERGGVHLWLSECVTGSLTAFIITPSHPLNSLDARDGMTSSGERGGMDSLSHP